MRLALSTAMMPAGSRWSAPAEIYDMIVGDEKIGHVSLRLGDDPDLMRYAGHVGYRVAPEHRGHGYAQQGVLLILPVARSRGIEPVWITCNPDNTASIRTLELLGAVYVETVELPKSSFHYRHGDRLKRRYRID